MDEPERPADEVSFEEALARLESIIELLESDEVDLDTALNRYEEGVRMARQCADRLERAQLRIQELSLDD